MISLIDKFFILSLQITLLCFTNNSIAQENNKQQTKKVEISKPLQAAIHESAKRFEKEYNLKPRYIIIDFYKNEKYSLIGIESRVNLFSDMDSDITAGTMFGTLCVVFYSSFINHNPLNLINTTKQKFDFDFISGDNVNTCHSTYEIVNNKLIIKESDCSVDGYNY